MTAIQALKALWVLFWRGVRFRIIIMFMRDRDQHLLRGLEAELNNLNAETDKIEWKTQPN